MWPWAARVSLVSCLAGEFGHAPWEWPGILGRVSTATPPARTGPRFGALAAEWLGILAVSIMGGQFVAGLLSLVLSPEVLGRLVWLPTPIVVFVLLALRVRGSTERYAWPGAAGLWWSLVGMVPLGWLGAVVGARFYPQLFGCGGDCTLATAQGLLAGASLLGLTGLVTVFVWRATVAATRLESS